MDVTAMTYRWTVRNMDPEAIDLIEEVASTSGLCFGELASEAIFSWYENLPEDGEVSEIADDGD